MPSLTAEDAPDQAKATYYLTSAPKLIAGATPKEYGLSFQANVELAKVNLDYGKLELEKETGEAFPLLQSIFLKCPQDGISDQASIDFLAEYENKGLIKFAAERLEGSQKFEGRQLKVRISRMLGKGKLEIAGQPQRSCLIYEFIEGDDLEKYPLPLASEIKASEFLNFALDLAAAVQKLHNQGVVHSFIVPRNLVRIKADARREHKTEIPEVCLVGFGYARLCDTRGKSGSPLNVLESDKLFRAPECRADTPHSAFWFPADIYSIGAILYHWLARMDPAKEVAKPDKQKDDLNVLRNLSPDVRLLKKTIADTLRISAPGVIEGNENILKILDSCLRFRAEDRFSCVEELIESIKLANSAGNVDNKKGEREQPLLGRNQSRVDVGAIEQWEPVPDQGTEGKLPPYFYELKHTLAESLKADFTAITSGHYEVYGHRDRIVTSLCHLLASAEPEDTYCTMTLPDYWADDNLGSNGRFLVMNKHMVRQGVNITRLYLVSREFHELSEGEQYILDQQLEAQEDLAKFAEDHDKKSKTSIKPGKMEIFVLKVDENIIGNFEKDGSMVGFLQKRNAGDPKAPPKNEDFVCLNFFSTANASWVNGKEIVKRRIHKVRYWRLNKDRRVRFDANKARFDNYVEDAMTLSRYIRQEEPDVKDFGIKELRDLIKGPPAKLEA